jgi:hypothetical protein
VRTEGVEQNQQPTGPDATGVQPVAIADNSRLDAASPRNQGKNPAHLAKLRTTIALLRNDYASRGHKLPTKPDTPALFEPHMIVGGRRIPTFVVARGEEYLSGKLTIATMVRTIDAATVLDICEYKDDRENGRLPEPDWSA